MHGPGQLPTQSARGCEEVVEAITNAFARKVLAMSLSRRLVPLALLCLGAISALSPVAAGDPIESLFRPGTGGASRAVDHGAWDRLLKTYVRPAENGLNRIDYKRFKADGHATLKAYLRQLEATDVTRLDRAEQFAFWANLYNAKTVDVVLDHYPVGSIRDINLGGGLFAAITGGPWKAKIVKVNGQPLSLDDIEHVILRGLFKDHRVHFAVNCASVGCPNVSIDAFTGDGLDGHLDRNARAFVNSPRGAKLVDGALHLSSIFNWFKGDFGGSDAQVLAHIRRYASPGLKARLAEVSKVADYFYDWRLNDVAG
jgi:hypothetical protein